MISTIGGAASQTRGSVFSPIPQTGLSVSLPVSQNTVVQQVPQQLVRQISHTEGAVVQQIPQQVVQQIPQTGLSVSLPVSQNAVVQ